jgi:hypothetical protein
VAIPDHVAAILAPPGQPIANRLLNARDLGDQCRREDWPAIRDATLDPATPNEVAMGCLEAISRMCRNGVVDDGDVEPVVLSVPVRGDRWCDFGAVQLLGLVGARWAVEELDRYVAPGRPGYDALRALVGHRHVVALSALRRYADDPERHPEVRQTARQLYDEHVSGTLRLAVLAERPADEVDRRVFAVLFATRAWANILILLRAGRGDAFTRACLMGLTHEDMTGRGRQGVLKRIKSAAAVGNAT